MKEDSESTWWGGLQSSDWCWLPKHRLHMPSIKMAMEPSATRQSVSTAHTVIQTPTLYNFSCMPSSMRAYTRHFQIHRHFWPFNGFVNYLIQLAIVNHEDCCFETQNWSWEAKIIIGQSEDSSFSLSSQIGTLNCITYSTWKGIHILST